MNDKERDTAGSNENFSVVKGQKRGPLSGGGEIGGETEGAVRRN